MSLSVSRFTRTLSGVATAAMVLTGISLVAIAPANAAPATVTVTGNDIRPNESTYIGWHEGYNNTNRAYFVDDAGLNLGVGDSSQVLNGTASVSVTTAELQALILSASVNAISGVATFQLPMFFGAGITQNYTTLYPTGAAPGVNTFSLGQQWISTGDISDGVTADEPATLQMILNELSEEGSIRMLGFGVQADSDAPATVTSLTWNGTDYVFQPYVATDPTVPVTVNERDVKSSETNDTYAEWHEGGLEDASVVKIDGLHLGTTSSSTVIKGITTGVASTQAELTQLITSASFDVSSGTASFQVPMYVNDTFTTLVSSTLGVGQHTFSLNDTWRTTNSFGPYDASSNLAPDALGDMLDAAFAEGDVFVIGFGVQADPAVVPTLVWDGTEYTFFQPETQACTTTPTVVTATNQDSNGWSFFGSGATGHNDFVAGGLHVWTESNNSTDAAVGSKAVNIPLKDAGVPSLNLSDVTGLAPGLQLYTDFDGDGTLDGNLVGESVYGDDYWVPDSSTKQFVKDAAPSNGSGSGSIYHGTLDQWLVPFPDAKIIGIGYTLAYAVGGSTLESITVGCTVFGFAEDAEYGTPAQVSVNDSQIFPIEGIVGWGDGYGHTPRSYSTQANGAHIGDGFKTQLINTFAAPLPTTELESLITSASVSVVDGSVNYQIPIFYGTLNGGNGTFTTIRSTPLAAGDHNFSVSDTWVSSAHLKDNAGAPYRDDLYSGVGGNGVKMPLADLMAFLNAQGNVRVLAVGALADAPAVIQDLVFNGTQYVFAPIESTYDDSVRVTEAEIAPNEEGAYAGWHDGGTGTSDATVEQNGLHLGNDEPTQIIMGLDAPLATDNLGALISAAAITVVEENVTYQVPIYYGGGNNFTTLRSLDLGDNAEGPGTYGFSLSDQWVSSATIAGTTIVIDSPMALGDMLDQLTNIRVLAFGVHSMYEATVSSIVWDGTRYYFDGPIEGTQPTISGTAKVGSTLTADAGLWTPEGVELHYQWSADGSNIGTDSASYALTGADAGKTISVAVTGSKVGYTDVVEISVGTDEVAAGDLVAGTPTITGAAQFGQQLTATPGAWSPSGVVFSYQWQVNGVDVAGATISTYTPVLADIGKTVTVVVTGLLSGYNTDTATATTAAVSGSAVVTVLPTITGTPVVDGTLTADPGEWAPSGVTFTYQWSVAGTPVSGETAPTYTPRSGDVGSTATVTVTGAFEGSIPVAVNSAATSAVVKATITAGTPVISGTEKVGNTLTAEAGTWTPTPVALSYQWKANGNEVGSDSATYALTGADAGKTITVTVTGTKAGYNTATGISLGTSEIADGDLSVGTATITGTAQVGETVTANPGTWGPGTVGLSYQWLQNSVAITGATSASYVVEAVNNGGTLTVEVTGTLAGYTTETAQATTAAVVPGELTTATPTIAGTAQVGATLTATALAWTPVATTTTYQWFADAVAITGATGSTYTLVAADLGANISVAVTGTRAGYTTATATSAPTSAVANGQVTATRLSGADRYATSVAISEEFTSATTVYIATGEGYADALSAGPAAAHFNAPLLLTTPGSLPAVVVTELNRLQPSEIVIVGGTGVVSAAVATALENLSFNPDVRRVSGSDRYATSRALATDTWNADDLGTAYLTTGVGFPDALSASPAAAHFDGPVILIPGMASTIDSATQTLLNTLGVDTVKIAGGTGVVSSAIEAQARVLFGSSNVTRNGGSNRYLTSVAINADEFSSAATVYLATGLGYADALAGAALAGVNGAPLFITETTCIPAATLSAILALGATNVVLLGGTGVLTAEVANLTSCG